MPNFQKALNDKTWKIIYLMIKLLTKQMQYNAQNIKKVEK